MFVIQRLIRVKVDGPNEGVNGKWEIPGACYYQQIIFHHHTTIYILVPIVTTSVVTTNNMSLEI